MTNIKFVEQNEKTLLSFSVSGVSNMDNDESENNESKLKKVNGSHGDNEHVSEEDLESLHMGEHSENNNDVFVFKLDKKDEVKYNKDDSIDDLDENIAEMNLETLEINDQDDTLLFSNVINSEMGVYNEDIVEGELSQADARQSHTPWNVIGLVIGGVALLVLVVVVVGVVARVVISKRKKKKDSQNVNVGSRMEQI